MCSGLGVTKNVLQLVVALTVSRLVLNHSVLGLLVTLAVSALVVTKHTLLQPHLSQLVFF